MTLSNNVRESEVIGDFKITKHFPHYVFNWNQASNVRIVWELFVILISSYFHTYYSLLTTNIANDLLKHSPREF